METEQTENPVTGVPKQVFEKFLADLAEKNISVDVISRLHKTLIERGSISEFEVKKALFDDNGADV